MAELVVALDFPTGIECLSFVGKISTSPVWYKVGLELFTAEGLALLHNLVGKKNKVFLDLKFHDIPNTVRGASRSVTKLGIDMFTIHLSGGLEMAKAAIIGREEALTALPTHMPQPLVMGVTMLTSDNGKNAEETLKRVVDLAIVGKEAGLDGVVCSGHEAKAVKEACGGDFLCLCPGIRFAGSERLDDQARVCTPEQAVNLGADFLVMGRPITKDANPKEKIEQVLGVIACSL